jgi:hypothetical protein
MHWNGLPAPTLLGIGLAAGAVIVGLYILKLRRRPVAVPFSRIWQRILRDQEATSLFSQLKRVLSLLLQLALLALLVTALGDPRGFVATSQRNVVVLVDASASMKAIDVATRLAPNRTRLDDAKDEVKKLIGGLGGSDRMLIAQMDASVTPLTTLTSDVDNLAEAASLLRASDVRADFPRALRFATDVVAGLPSPEIVVVSDGALGEARDGAGSIHLGDAQLRFVPVGKRGRNVGITEFSVRRYPFDRDRYEVLLELYNAAQEPLEVELDLVGDGNLVDMTKLRLKPGERLPRFYPNLTGARHTLEASLKLTSGERDDLPADDHAYALLPDQRRIRVLCVTSGNTYLEAALLLTTYLDVTYMAPAAYAPPRDKTYDVTVFDGVALEVSANSGSVLYLNPSGPSSPVKVDPAPLTNVGFDTVDKRSPLLKYTSMEDAYVGRAHRLVPGPGDKVIGASEKGALLVTGRRDGASFVALGFDPRESDLVLRMAWPVFVLNVLGSFVAEDPSYISSFRTGDVWHVPAPTASDELRIVAPGGVARRVPAQDGRAVYLGVDAGFYTLEAGPEGSAAKTEFAGNLSDPEESTIEPRTTLEVDGRPASPVTGFRVGVRSEWWIVLLVLAVLLTTIEWLTYHRRITV